jgi:catechol 2,3-dioxygenase-like lactoylglutathione lyase family enzyme
MTVPPLVPELQVSDLATSLDFYTRILGFSVLWERSEERFAYLERQEAHVMMEEAGGPGRRIAMGSLERPFGRGVNFQILTSDIDALAGRIAAAGCSLIVPVEERWYRTRTGHFGQRQFILADPDGYLLRFAQELRTRS